MKFRSIALLATLAAVAAWPSLVSAEAASQERQTTTPAFQETIPNIPGKSLVGLVVNYPPGGATQAHYHPRSAFVTGYDVLAAYKPPPATVITPGWSTNRVASRSCGPHRARSWRRVADPEPETDGRSTHQPPITEALVPAHRPPKVAKAFESPGQGGAASASTASRVHSQV